MNREAPVIISAEEQAILEERLAAFDRDGMGHTLEAFQAWAEARKTDPKAPWPAPTKLR